MVLELGNEKKGFTLSPSLSGSIKVKRTFPGGCVARRRRINDWTVDTASSFAVPSACKTILQPSGQGTRAGETGRPAAMSKVSEPIRVSGIFAWRDGFHCPHHC